MDTFAGELQNTMTSNLIQVCLLKQLTQKGNTESISYAS